MSILERIANIRGKIVLKSGLHIGSGSEGIYIGGIDNPVIKDSKTGYPYIPGSSLKGKVRSLLELKKGITEPCNCGQCDICRVFGNTNPDSAVGPTRAVFRDSFLSEDSIKMLDERNLLPTETKMENTIDRIRGTAQHPRTMERAIAGLSFDFELSVRIFDGDNNISLDLLREGLAILQDDALGGNSSRGYGKIEFGSLTIDSKNFELGN